MNEITKIVNILLIISVIGALIAGYFWFMGGEEASFVSDQSDPDVFDVESAGASVSGDISISSAEVVVLLERIRRINLDDALFTSPAFQSLGNTAVELTPEAEGIGNPFGEF